MSPGTDGAPSGADGADAAVERAAPPGAEPVVDVRDAFCLLPEPALRGLTLHVRAGERVVVHGPNGSGKTTLLRVLSGEQPLSAGRASVAGRDITGSAGDLVAWRVSRLGWLDVLDNVALQQRLAGVRAIVARAAARDALERLGAGHLATRSVVTLSGGEAQRVAVCAAIAHRPRLVLADEPTGQLDAEAAEEVYDALAAAVLDSGSALVLVSHDRGAARIADRVVRIRDGRLSETWAGRHGDRAGAGGDVQESLIVDDRGWVRLPEPLRRTAGVRDTVQVHLRGSEIILEPTPGALRPAPGSLPDVAALQPYPLADRSVIATLRGVTKAYGGRQVLSGIDLDVPAGRLLVVRGRSGSGKSTLLRVLVGLEHPDAGTAHVDGVDVSSLDRAGLASMRRRLAAVVGQDVHLAEAEDVAGNLELARPVRGLEADPGEGGAADRRWLDALGIGALAHRRVDLLSGGERQRVAVARALAVAPRLLVLDEPSSQLDEASAEQLAGVLRRAAAGGTAVVVASHDPVLVAAADIVHDLAAAPWPRPRG
jgi:ABC-type lipoprotein export system ATPase subunit